MDFLISLVAMILCILSFRVQRRFDRYLIQLASFLVLIYSLHRLHVF